MNRESTEVYAPLKPKIDPSTKVTRYRAGQVPHFATGYEEERGFVTANSQVRSALTKKQGGGGDAAAASGSSAPSQRRRFEAQVVAAKTKDISASSPNRSAGRRGALSEDDDSSSGEDAADALKDSSSDDDEEEFNRRRRLLRSKVAEKEQQQSGVDGADELSTAVAKPERRVSLALEFLWHQPMSSVNANSLRLLCLQ